MSERGPRQEQYEEPVEIVRGSDEHRALLEQAGRRAGLTREEARRAAMCLTSGDRQKWEYDTLGSHSVWPVDYMQTMGQQGWELVSVCMDSEGAWHFFFKRPIAI